MSRSQVVASFCLAMSLLVVSPGVAVAAPNITGKYKIMVDGKTAWTVEIVKVKNAYKVTWTEKGTGNVQTGIGLLENDVFACSWKDKGAGGDNGVYLYRVKDNGDKLIGQWVNQKGDLEAEVLFKMK